MSTFGSPGTHETIANGTTDFVLDVQKLHALPSEQQDLFLLTFVSDLWRHVEGLSTEALPAHQPLIKKEVVKIIGLGTPASSRITRNNLGQILAAIFSRGSRSLLFETVNDLLGIITLGKGDRELGVKHAAVVSLGHIYRAAGDSAISLSGLVCSTLLKLLKASQSHAGLRGSIYQALGFISIGLGASIDENVARDVWKSARSAASNDKAAIVQKCACNCLQSLILNSSVFNNSNDFDNLKAAIWKNIDSNIPSVRYAAANSLAGALLSAYSDAGSSATVPIVRKPKKSSKKKDSKADEDGETERPGSPAPTRPSLKLVLNLRELLRVLSVHYCKASTSNKGRAGLITCYRLVLTRLPDKVVEEGYGTVADHFFTELLNHPTIIFHRYRTLLSRKFVSTILEDVVARQLLSENGQINAAKWLINEILKNYPKVIQERREPPKRVLSAALKTLADLIQCLGSATVAVQDQCREALLQIMQHPSYTVQVHGAQCLREFAAACPQQFLRTIEACMSLLKKEFDHPPEQRHSHRKCTGYANGLAAILSTSRHHPLYGSVEIFSKTLTLATDLLKASSGSELRLSATQIQVAWILIGGLMSIGPSFVKIHLNQLLLLWRNALPVPLTTENAAKRGHLELSFLSHVRECALGAMLVFLDFNSSLLTIDGSRRISTMLHNSILFLSSLPNNRQTEDISNRLVPALQLHDLSIMLQRRLLQCFTALVGIAHLDHKETLSRSDILSFGLRSFTNPDNPAPRSLESSIASSASNFDRIWDTGDNWAFGVSSLVRGYNANVPDIGDSTLSSQTETAFLDIQDSIDSAVDRSIGSGLEHDSILLYSSRLSAQLHNLSPPATAVVDNAIILFAATLPLQSPKVQESTLEQLATVAAQPFPREPGKKAAIQINASTALLYTLLVANGECSFPSGKLATNVAEKIMAEILRRSIADPDPIGRNLGAIALGRLCNLSGSEFTNSEVKHLIDTIIANRDPQVRAGCALSLGYIHALVGGMAASFHLKSIVGVLLSLCSDSHPVVHYWALKGLIQVSDSAGLTFSSFATSTLGLLAQLYTADSHNNEAAPAATSNLEMEFDTPALLSQCVDSVINVLGPDLQDVSKARQLILTLVGYFRRDDCIEVQAQGSTCLGHLSMYAPAHLPFAKYVTGLQSGLASNEPRLQSVSVEGLGNLMKRNAQEVARVAPASLASDIWLKLDEKPNNIMLQNMLRNWLEQSFLLETAEWVEQCQNILSKTRVKTEQKVAPITIKSTAMPDLADEEVAGFAQAAAVAQGENPDLPAEGLEFLRWQTRGFAMSLLSELLRLVSDAILPEQAIPAETTLQGKVADVIRMAFSASTANVIELRIWGLKILDQILNLFGRTPDPDFLEASLLEQYQAQISSALTPAFAADSSPALAAEAVSVCATFVATGIVTNVDRMGRIFKILVTGLDNIATPSPEASIGELKSLSSNAQSMLKMAILSAWAQLILAGNEQPYLEEIVQPFIPRLAPLWLASLQEYASLRFEPEISSSLGGEVISGNMDDQYAAFNRETRLKFYQANWLIIVDAIAVLVDKDSDSIFDALDNKQIAPDSPATNGAKSDGRDMSFREEPVAFFFILFGLAFEALVMQAREDPSQTLSILQALKKILRPAVCGTAIYQDVVFTETTDALDRLAMTSKYDTQSVLVEVSRNLSLNHISANSEADRVEKLSDDIDQLFELTRIVVLVLTGLVPTLEDPPSSSSRPLTEEAVSLVQRSFKALVEVAEVFPSVIRADLHACIIHCFCTVLATGVCQADAVPKIIPTFRDFVQDVAVSRSDGSTRLVRGCLMRLLMTLSYAQRRENEFALPCAKNTLLSITILLTTAGAVISPKDELVVKSVSEFLDCLQDIGLAKVAANCIRSLLLTNPKTFCDEGICRLLFSKLLLFVADSEIEDPESVKSTIAQALTTSVKSMPRTGRYAAMAILIPTLLSNAKKGSPSGSTDKKEKETAARLLELASIDPAAFKASVAMLNEEQHAFLESILRTVGAGNHRRHEHDGSVDIKPTIELRMDFD